MIAQLAVALALAAAPAPATPIEHFVVLMQENHSFDNYFGTFPGADGIPPGTCMPVGRRAGRACARFTLAAARRPIPAHDAGIHRDGRLRPCGVARPPVGRALRDGLLRRPRPAVLLERRRGLRPLRPLLRGLAPRQRRQPSALGGRDLPPARGAWRSRGGSTSRTTTRGWDAAARRRCACRCGTPSRHVVDLDEFYEDLDRDRLPAVAYIAPAGASEHPPGRVSAGATLTRALITALARSSAWDSSAFMWTYDESGGWFDHVRPPRGCRLSRAGASREPLRAPRLRGQHAARHHFHPRLHRAQLAAGAGARRTAAPGPGLRLLAASARGAHRLRRPPCRRAPADPHLGDLPGLRGGARRRSR